MTEERCCKADELDHTLLQLWSFPLLPHQAGHGSLLRAHLDPCLTHLSMSELAVWDEKHSPCLIFPIVFNSDVINHERKLPLKGKACLRVAPN